MDMLEYALIYMRLSSSDRLVSEFLRSEYECLHPRCPRDRFVLIFDRCDQFPEDVGITEDMEACLEYQIGSPMIVDELSHESHQDCHRLHCFHPALLVHQIGGVGSGARGVYPFRRSVDAYSGLVTVNNARGLDRLFDSKLHRSETVVPLRIEFHETRPTYIDTVDFIIELRDAIVGDDPIVVEVYGERLNVWSVLDISCHPFGEYRLGDSVTAWTLLFSSYVLVYKASWLRGIEYLSLPYFSHRHIHETFTTSGAGCDRQDLCGVGSFKRKERCSFVSHLSSSFLSSRTE